MNRPNPNDVPLYAGLSMTRLAVESFDLGRGVALARTFAHIFAPYLMAFAPPPPGGGPHPAPWKSASGGFAYDLHAQLFIPSEFEAEEWFDRLNTAWWIAALLRLRVSPVITVPVLSDISFSDAATSDREPVFWPIEMVPRRAVIPGTVGEATIQTGDLDWLRARWITSAKLMRDHDVFNRAFQSFDAARFCRSTDDALLVLWGVLEQLFSRRDQELRFRVAAVISSFLEPPGARRLDVFDAVKQLYDQRSKAAHGSHADADTALHHTHELARRCLIAMLDGASVPEVRELESNIFDNRLWP